MERIQGRFLEMAVNWNIVLSALKNGGHIGIGLEIARLHVVFNQK